LNPCSYTREPDIYMCAGNPNLSVVSANPTPVPRRGGRPYPYPQFPIRSSCSTAHRSSTPSLQLLHRRTGHRSGARSLQAPGSPGVQHSSSRRPGPRPGGPALQLKLLHRSGARPLQQSARQHRAALSHAATPRRPGRQDPARLRAAAVTAVSQSRLQRPLCRSVQPSSGTTPSKVQGPRYYLSVCAQQLESVFCIIYLLQRTQHSAVIVFCIVL
jgi:hypothetical protein